MPQVPLYDGPQVAPRPVNYDQASADSFGARQGRDLERVGAGVSALGQALDQVNEREVQTEVFNAEAKVKSEYVKWSQEAVRTRQGVGAKGLAKDTGAWWGKAAETYGKDLTPQARRMLSRSLTQQSLAAAQSMGNYENAQLDAAQQVALEATLKASIDSAIMDSSEANIATQRQNYIGAFETQRGKYDEQTFNTLRNAKLSQFHTAIFNKLFVDSPTQAKLYYEVNQKEIDGTVKDEILTRLKAGVADEQGGKAAREEFLKAIAGKGYNDAIPYDQIDAALVSRFEDSPESLKAARAELDRQVAIRNKAQTEYSAGNIEAVYGFRNRGMGIAQIRRTAQWAALPAKMQNDIQYEWDQRARAAQTNDLQARINIEREMQLRYAPEMLRMSQPEVISKMTREDILNLQPTIGTANATQLMETWQQYQTNQTKLSDATIENDIFKSVLAGAGINPSPRTNDKEGSQLVIDLRAQARATIGAMQTAQKRPLTEEEKTKVIQDIVHAQVLRPGWWSGEFTKEAPMYSLKPGELNTSAVQILVNGKPQPLPLSQIPANEYAVWERKLRARGITATPAEVAQYWYDEKNSGGTGRW